MGDQDKENGGSVQGKCNGGSGQGKCNYLCIFTYAHACMHICKYTNILQIYCYFDKYIASMME